MDGVSINNAKRIGLITSEHLPALNTILDANMSAYYIGRASNLIEKFVKLSQSSEGSLIDGAQTSSEVQVRIINETDSMFLFSSCKPCKQLL